ncbi:MAG: acyl-CoA dehydrogenase family protein [Armatimonadota bacterium]|nr:acyl-CoA dehydrogenase family protein [Armatimonadota bacterium]MDR7444906.1 acyl-CoA dehydrogenase family protein [Armatimonadota bacterium]MDR7569125.1 acyl-CoA dehydrogenase family protein [Armatimonadota bacterium]MDR7613429.1 acyl-CoA dehydrogenase family protein [Armatimonadota bacterium]
MEARAALPGGGFLIARTSPEAVFTPEDLGEEHRMVRRTAAEFFQREVLPRMEEIERQNWEVTRALLRRLGELGFLGVGIPEAYGGSGLDQIASLVIAEEICVGSFPVTFGGHVGIGMLPIAFFGTEDQKRRYLPPMVRGEKIGAYALTEPTAGSDAMAIQTRAVLSPDGRYYLLTGQKQFITNAALADVFITYAKVNGEHFTAFIVDRDTEGLTLGEEEHKMGMKGSSTRSVFLENARVPAENLLGEVGKGHRVAFNILNLGRFKIGASCTGAAKYALQLATRYALDRRQFGRPIAEFGLIRQKLARMAVEIYATESMVYRTGGLVEGAIGGIQVEGEVVRALEEYAIESSINKVFASEMLGRAVDELVQIYGGYGYIEDYPAARAYRDARINRIWEGTNEINRLLIVDMLSKRAQRGRLDLLPAIQRVGDGLTSPEGFEAPEEGPLAEEAALVEGIKRAALLSTGVAVRRYLLELEEQQEIVGWLADLAMEAFAAESAVLRAQKAFLRQDPRAPLHTTLARAYLHMSLPRVETTARSILAASEEGDDLRTALAGLRRLLRYTPANLVQLQREVAQAVVAAEGYPL